MVVSLKYIFVPRMLPAMEKAPAMRPVAMRALPSIMNITSEVALVVTFMDFEMPCALSMERCATDVRRSNRKVPVPGPIKPSYMPRMT